MIRIEPNADLVLQFRGETLDLDAKEEVQIVLWWFMSLMHYDEVSLWVNVTKGD